MPQSTVGSPPVARWRLAPLGRPGRGTHSNHCVTWTASSVSVPTFQPATEPCGFLFLADLRSIACSPAGLPWSCSRPHGFSPGPRKSSPNCSAPYISPSAAAKRRLWKPRTFPWLPLAGPSRGHLRPCTYCPVLSPALLPTAGHLTHCPAPSSCSRAIGPMWLFRTLLFLPRNHAIVTISHPFSLDSMTRRKPNSHLTVNSNIISACEASSDPPLARQMSLPFQ